MARHLPPTDHENAAPAWPHDPSDIQQARVSAGLAHQLTQSDLRDPIVVQPRHEVSWPGRHATAAPLPIP